MKRVFSLLLLTCASFYTSAQITGAGASFPAPVYSQWAEEYNAQTGKKINYQSVGSGAGIRQIQAGTVDFGASDMPLSDDELRGRQLTQFPTVIGGVVPVVNIEGVKPSDIRLTGEMLADIYLGKITKWNDPAIVALNRNVNLPNATIAVIRRSDGSGTTFLFTNYLSKVSVNWKEKVGDGTAVNWPLGIGGKGNEGVAAFVKRLPNSIGYVEYSYAVTNKLTTIKLSNSTTNFVEPNEESFKAAAAGADWKTSFYQVLTNQPGSKSWPITGATFILLRNDGNATAKRKEVLEFFDWAFKNGDKSAIALTYIPLPLSVKNLSRGVWK